MRTLSLAGLCALLVGGSAAGQRGSDQLRRSQQLPRCTRRAAPRGRAGGRECAVGAVGRAGHGCGWRGAQAAGGVRL
eukprot:2284727-Prymnesium_polylepis.1